MQPALSSSPNSALPLAKKPAVDALSRAAGLLIMTPNGDALFLRYVPERGGEWCIPAGGIEVGETPDAAAVRETHEETGWTPQDKVKLIEAWGDDKGGGFSTFATISQNQFIPELSDEHDSWCWAPLSNPPEPLHPGLSATIESLLDEDLLDEAQDSYNASASTKAELRDTIKFPPDKAPEASRAINIAYANGGTTGGAAKQSVETNKYINSGGATRRDRMRAKRQQAVLDEFRESEHPRDHGQFSSVGGGTGSKKEETKSRVGSFIKSGQAKQAVSAAAGRVLGAAKEHHKELLAGAVTFSLYHIVGADFPMDIEAAIHSQVEHLASNLGVSKSVAVAAMKDAVGRLQGLRSKGAMDAEDDIDTVLMSLMKVLDKLE
jgi:8-oxo-dGTP pyrophosphatase MutT (NUDIX family)